MPPKPPYVCMYEDCERIQLPGLLYCREHTEDEYEHVPFDAEPDDDVIMWAEKDGTRNVPADPTWAREKGQRQSQDDAEWLAWWDEAEDGEE